MRNGSAKSSAPRLLALTAMLLSLGFAGVEDGIVLCLGGDGHVAIEVVGLEGCAAVAETADSGSSALVIPVSSSHCGPCVDLAITSSTATGSVEGTKRTLSAAAAIPSAGLRPPVPHRRASIPYPHTTGFASEKTHTVVIRC